MRLISLILFISFYLNSFSQSQLLNQDSIEKICKQKPDSNQIVIINFWATWCKPCVHELPYFNDFIKNDSSKIYQFIFISFDGKSNQTKLDKFISKKELLGKHILAVDIDFQTFIDNINPQWIGDIPLTIKITNSDIFYKFGSFENSEEFIQWIK